MRTATTARNGNEFEEHRGRDSRGSEQWEGPDDVAGRRERDRDHHPENLGAGLPRRVYSVISWCKTPDGWAVNLDGTDASAEFSLPRIELHSGPNGWTCVCHRQNGTFVKLPLGIGTSAEAAKHAAAEAMLALGTEYDAQLLALLTGRSA